MGGGYSKPKKGASSKTETAAIAGKEETPPKSAVGRPKLKLLLLGTGGVGKSTIHKQVVRCYSGGETADDRSKAIDHVRKLLVLITSNVTEVIIEANEADPEAGENTTIKAKPGGHRLSNFALKHQVADPSDDFFDSVQEVQNISNRGLMAREFPALGKYLAQIWSEPAFKKAFTLAGNKHDDKEMIMNLHTAHIFSETTKRIIAVFDTSFQLTAEEYILLRQPTKGVQISTGLINKKVFQVLDVGGQAHFQNEWPHTIKGLKVEKECALGIVFMIALDDYGHIEKVQSAFSRGQKSTVGATPTAQSNCSLNLSLEIWDDYMNRELMTEPTPIPVMLLLNKDDLFREELQEDPSRFHQTFPNVKTKSSDESDTEYEDRCIRAILKKFQRSYEKSRHFKEVGESLKYRVTNATDQKMVQDIIEKYVQFITEMSMMNMGLVGKTQSYKDGSSKKKKASLRSQKSMSHVKTKSMLDVKADDGPKLRVVSSLRFPRGASFKTNSFRKASSVRAKSSRKASTQTIPIKQTSEPPPVEAKDPGPDVLSSQSREPSPT